MRGSVAGGTLSNDQVEELADIIYFRTDQSSNIPTDMRMRQDRNVIFSTVPFHFFQSQNPPGSYSHTMGRLAVFASAHSVNLFNRPLLQPGFDGIPKPSRTDACKEVYAVDVGGPGCRFLCANRLMGIVVCRFVEVGCEKAETI